MADRKEPHLHGNAPDTTPNRTTDPGVDPAATDTRRDAAYTPTGSSRAGVAAPKKRSGGMLWAALAAVLAVLALVWFIGLGGEELAEEEVIEDGVVEGEVVDEDVAVETAPVVTTDEELIESDQAEVVPLETEGTGTDVAVEEAPAVEGAVEEETIAETAGELETEAEVETETGGAALEATDEELIPEGEGTEVQVVPVD
jgi:hypothetical protein